MTGYLTLNLEFELEDSFFYLCNIFLLYYILKRPADSVKKYEIFCIGKYLKIGYL